jgi:hypothetical protein
VRLQQIATLLNLDHVRSVFLKRFFLFFYFLYVCDSDGFFFFFFLLGKNGEKKQEEGVDEFYNGSGITWKLSEQEARAVAGLRL